MTFPLALRTEFLIDGAWVKVPTYERDTVEVDYGRPERATTADPGQMAVTVNNRDGRFSPRNPMSPYYGKISRNTRARLSVSGGTPYMRLVDDTDRARTPDSPAISITGDLDVRVDLTMDQWTGTGTLREVAGQYDNGDLSWVLFIWSDGRPTLWWSADGATIIQKFPNATPLAPAEGERRAFRATLDVDNGAGGSTCRFYMAPTLAGPWTEIGTPVVTAGVTAIYDSASPLDVGAVGLLSQADAVGRVYGAEVRRGIGGTVVAAPDFTSLTPGTTSWTDTVGVPWTLDGDAVIDDQYLLFMGEISEWPQKWTPDGADAWVPLVASGVLRRMSQGKKALQSTLRRAIPGARPRAYWPMEEGPSASRAYSALPGGDSLYLTNCRWADDDSLVSSGALPTLQSDGAATAVLGATIRQDSWASLPAWSVHWMYRVPQVPANRRTLMRVLSSGTVRDWYVQCGPTDSRLQGIDYDGTTVVDQVIGTSTDIFGTWVKCRLSIEQVGTAIRYTIVWSDINGSAGQYTSTLSGATAGRPTTIASPPGGFHADINGMAIGHISVWDSVNTGAYAGAMAAWTGETATARMQRLANEEALDLKVLPGTVPTERVGPQKADTLLALLQAAADADGGLLLEDRHGIGLLYRERSSLYSQTPALTLSYDQAPGLAAPLEPVDDDTAIRNDRTVRRDAGSEGRAVLEAGPLSVQDPPVGIGLYDDSVTLSLHSDTQTEPIAHWRLWLGTQDAPRYPTVRIMLHKAPGLIPAVLGLTEGALVRITGLPLWVGAGDVDLIVDSVHHAISLMEWTVTLTCQPGDPWQIGAVGDALRGRADVDEGGSTLALPTTATDPQLLVHTPGPGLAGALPWIASAGPAPTYPDEFPFDVQLGGEHARVTACVPAAHDAFGRTVTAGWGVSDSGLGWVGAQGAASDRSVTSGMGVITLATAPDTTRLDRILSGITDAEVLVRVSVSQLATGAALLPGILFRYTSPTGFYRARVHFNPGGTMVAAVTRDYSAIGSTPTLPWTYTAGQWFWVRARVTGDLVQMRVWPSGQDEPAVWHKEAVITGSPIISGQIGVASASFAGNTNTNPQIRYDDFRVVTPQILTVDRSVNGITKAHASGTSVRLAHPAHTGL